MGNLSDRIQTLDGVPRRHNSLSLTRSGSNPLQRISLLIALFIATCVPFDQVEAQSLDLNLDAAAASGVTFGTSDNSTYSGRTPLYLNMDMALVFDNDATFELVVGTMIQIESQPALALNPKVRVVKRLDRFDVYAEAGLPWYVVPFRRLGFELGGGGLIPFNDVFSLVTGLSIQTFFAGADVPDDSAVLAITGRFGGRIAF